MVSFPMLATLPLVSCVRLLSLLLFRIQEISAAKQVETRCILNVVAVFPVLRSHFSRWTEFSWTLSLRGMTKPYKKCLQSLHFKGERHGFHQRRIGANVPEACDKLVIRPKKVDIKVNGRARDNTSRF